MYAPTEEDRMLEAVIAEAMCKVHQAPTPRMRQTAWEHYALVHSMRSPEMVAYLELQMGIGHA